MNLQQLIAGLRDLSINSPPLSTIGTTPISTIVYDSRQVQAGSVFFAISGFHTDGNNFVKRAEENGAIAVIGDAKSTSTQTLTIPYIEVSNVRRALSDAIAAYYDHPAQHMCIFGVTGTDGKTTVSSLIHDILTASHYKALLLTTAERRMGESTTPNEARQSTLEAPEIQSYLADGLEQATTHAVLEVTSHGLALEKVRGCAFDVGVITNITRDHLDFHKTIENYKRAKASLFEMLGEETKHTIQTRPYAVLNRDDSSYEYLKPFCHTPILTYGLHKEANIRAIDIELKSTYTRFRMVFPDMQIDIETPFIGVFNISNCLAAVAAVYSQGLSLQDIAYTLAHVRAVKGRMEHIHAGQPCQVIIDYAHTPQGLARVLKALRDFATGRVIVVFGSAGERDKEKRPIMGRIVAELANYFIITNEDPREEDEQKILRDIAHGATEARKIEGKDFFCIADRAEAIQKAFLQAKAGDIVLLAGKGHEQCIIVGTENVPWDEETVARNILQKSGYGERKWRR